MADLTADTPKNHGIPWALHSFGYVAGLPEGKTDYECRLVFETARRVLVVSLAAEPVGSHGHLTISPIGPLRVVFSVVADAPEVMGRHHVVGLEVDIANLHSGSVAFSVDDEAAPERCHSIILGDPSMFTYDRDERLAIRNAVWKVEDAHLSKELTRSTIPGLQTDLLLESPLIRRVPQRVAFDEIRRQLLGAMREDSWGYLWNRDSVPSPRDGSSLALSRSLTETMNAHLYACTETILRACGAKPQPRRRSTETGTEVLDAVAYALVAMRRGVDVSVAARPVLAAVGRYGKAFDVNELRRSRR